MHRRVLLVIVLSVTVGICAAQEIPLTNPGFEVDADGMPDGWNFVTHGVGFSAAISDAEAYSGERSVRMTGAPDHGNRSALLQLSAPTEVSPGYRLRFFAKGTGNPGVGIFRLRWDREAEGVEHQTEHFEVRVSADDWTENVFEFAARADALEIGTAPVEIILYQRGEGDLYYDDVSVELMPEAPKPEVAPVNEALQTPRRPQQGKTVLQNPPDLTWPPQAGADAYELQLARSEDFAAPQTIGDLPYNCYSHSEVLDADARWWWRYRYTRGDRTSEWSEAWSFEIAPDAAEFPVPPPDELLARVPESHPRVYATADTLEQFRAPRLDERADWWEQFQARCDVHLQKQIPSEPGPEYDFSGRSGSLTAEEKSRMDALRGLGHGATGPMWEMGFGYLVSGDDAYGQRAVEWLMELSRWDVEGTTGYHNHDQVFRDIAWKSACVYDWCHDLMTEDERAAALEMVQARGGILYRDFREDDRPIYAYPFNSHGWTSMGFLGIIACATVHDSARADDWLQFIAATYPPLYPPWGGEEGGWCQGTDYWKWSVRFFAEFADALASATGVDLFDKAFCRNNGWFKLSMHPPFCDRHHFGDGNLGRPGSTDRNNQLLYATRYDNPYFKWYADQIHGTEDSGVFGYWWYDYDMPARPPIDVPQSRYLADIGWVGMHSDMSDPDDIMLIFKSSWFGSFNHSHADQNHFVVYGHGEPLLIDSGYYDWYASDHDRNWTRHTKAHNSILVDGEGQPTFDITAKGEIVDYFESPIGCYTAGDATAAYDGKLTKFVRHILYLRPDAFVVIDELAAEEPKTWTWAAHALEEMQIDERARTVTVRKGDTALDIAFATPEALAFTQDDDWDGHPPQGRYEDKPRQWHLYAETTEPSETQRFMALMRVRDGGEPAEFASRPVSASGSFVASMGNFMAGVTAPYGEPAFSNALIEAPFAAVTNSEDTAQLLAVACSHVGVAHDDRPYMTASQPVTIAVSMHSEGELIRADIEADFPTEVSMWVHRDLDGLSLNGEPLTEDRCTWDAQMQTLTLSLQPGTYSIAAPEARPVAEGSLGLTIDGEAPAQLDQEVLPGYTGSGLLSASFNAEEGLARLAEAPDADVTLNGASLDEEGQMVWLRDSNSLEARMSRPAEVQVALTRLSVAGEPVVAEVLDGPPEGAVKIEAESFVDYSMGQPSRYSHRTFLSGGVGVGEWIVPGMSLHWEIEAPTPGDYNLVLKGATHQAMADRLIMLDGEPVGGQWQVYRFEHTGGYGAQPQQWQHLLVLGEDEQPLTLTLGEGSHDLTMVCIDSRLNLDYLMLVPAG